MWNENVWVYWITEATIRLISPVSFFLMWLLGILKSHVGYVIFGVDSATLHPLCMVELWLMLTSPYCLYFSNWK